MIPASTIREAISATPFRPFRIRTAIQRSYEIGHPDWLSIGPKDRSLVIWGADGGVSMVDVAQITGIELLEPGYVGSRETRMMYSFDLILRGVAEITDALEHAAFAAGCDDSLLWSRDGIVGLHFCREAESLGTAIGSAVKDVERAGYAVARVEVDDPASVG
jgi:hypothetical protein